MKKIEILDYIKQINLITPKPGDILVVTVDEVMSYSHVMDLTNMLKKILEDRGLTDENSSVVVLNNKISIEIIRKEE